MLKIRNLVSYDERHQIRHSIRIRDETLIVADLHTKLEIQKDLLTQSDLLEGNTVLRAHELWTKIWDQIQPHVKVISPTLARSLILQWLEKDDIPWARTSSATAHVFKYIQQLLPLLCNKSSHEIMNQWLEDHPGALIRWGGWFHLAFQYWENFNSLQLIPHPFISAHLAGSYKGQKVWDRKIILDLGCDLTPVESDLLQQMQHNHEIEVLKPDPPWALEHLKSLSGYYFLESKPLEEKKVEEIHSFKPHVKFLRFSTMVSEVKAVTAKVRQWLDRGAGLGEITLLAPDIETYWTVLRLYFQQEGIPIEKPKVIPLIARPEISKWLSTLRLKSGKTSYEDLEMAEFAEDISQETSQENSETTKESFQFFSRMFKNIYSHEDLKRIPHIDEKFSSRLSGDDLLDRDEFVLKSLHLWRGQDPDSLQKLYNYLFQDAPPKLQLTLSRWVMYVEELCARIETETEGPSLGIQFTNIRSGPHRASQYIYIIGFSESALRPQMGTAIEWDEVLKIYQDTGFIIDSPDHRKNEFESQWLFDGNFKEICVSFSSSHFSGAVEGPSRLWLQGAMSSGANPEEVKYPEPSRWDEIQLSSMDDKQLRGWSHLTHRQETKEFLKPQIKPLKKPSLSVTQLENYAKCPFIFAANKLFHLRDLPDMDMDVDSMTKGRLMHAIFKKLTETSFRANYTKDELFKIIESCRKEEARGQIDPKSWKYLWPSLLKLTQRFLLAESELRSHFPKLCTKGEEIPIEVDWDLKSGGFTSRGTGDYEFTGSIDRVDSNGGTEASVIDYKSSGGNLKNIKSWPNGNQFQLTLYSQIIEKGLATLDPHEVCSAFYYVSRDMTREKGFRMKDRGGDLFEATARNSLKSAEVQEIQNQIMSQVQNIVQQIDKGNFNPEPRDPKDCKDCYWKHICRSPHLN